jgi:methionyl-tRNA formyltransferase
VEKASIFLFSANYAWLIPVPAGKVFTVNVHPTLLPEGRGPTPLPWLLKKYQNYAGVTFHKLSSQFDEGDIIYQKPIQLDSRESLETMIVKLHFEIPVMLDELLSNFTHHYHSALKQLKGSYWPKVGLNDRVIDWKEKVGDIEQLARAFGRLGVIAIVKGQALLVNHIEVSQSRHHWSIGSTLIEDDDTLVIAASDGFVIIMRGSIIEIMDLSKLSLKI